MKKYLSGFVAILFAIGMSAFTKPAQSQKFINLWYKDASGFHAFQTTEPPCEQSTEAQCVSNVEGVGVRPIYLSNDNASPYLTRDPR